MARIARLVIAVCGALVALQALALWNATGRGAWTIHFDPARAEREQAASSAGVADLFDDTGLQDAAGKLERVPNEFRFGLLPSTYPWRVWDKDFPSVATVGGPGALAALLALALPLLTRRTPAPP
jgi:hypothetical protein